LLLDVLVAGVLYCRPPEPTQYTGPPIVHIPPAPGQLRHGQPPPLPQPAVPPPAPADVKCK
jgi:hypothetical protein